MNSQNPLPVVFPFRVSSPSGLSAQVNENGSIRRMDCGDIMLNLFLGTEAEGGPANIYMRSLEPSGEATPLLGPRSSAGVCVDERGLTAAGEWMGIRFHVSLRLAESATAWFWHVAMRNVGDAARTLDLIYVQDLGLANYGAVRLNEFYTGHYVDHTALSHPDMGLVLASRQNLPMAGRNPWTMIGSLARGVSYATDGLQFHGLASRAGRVPAGIADGLPNERLQHEHSMAAIQDVPVRLEPGAAVERGFFGWFQADHPQATSADDLAIVGKAIGLPDYRPEVISAPAPVGVDKPATSLFISAPLLEAVDLTETEVADIFGAERRHEERVEGRLLSFFLGENRHVVLKAKELEVLRPHAHILRTGHRLIPDETSLTSTTWMGGVFHSMVTQGHVSINRFTSTVHGYLSLFRANGLRVFVWLDGGWRMLDVPSAYEMSPQACRWIYKYAEGMIEIRSRASVERHELTLSVAALSGPPLRLLVSNHLAINGDDGSDSIPARTSTDEAGVCVHSLPDTDVGRRFPEGTFRISPLSGTRIEQAGGDELLFSDGRSRNQPFLGLLLAPARSVGLRLTGHLISQAPADAGGGCGPMPKSAERDLSGLADEAGFWPDLTTHLQVRPPASSPLAGAAQALGEILPWFVHNALIHYLAPRGIEQYSGGGWGTRDICQGPVEMLLALGRFEPIRDLLVRVFKNQNPDGDWPQWFMFFDRERNIRPEDSHGDIVFWPLVALSDYLTATEDRDLLDEPVPFFHPQGDEKAERSTIRKHVERALAVIQHRVIPGTRLAAYGHGDWNDSMQPLDPAMRERLCSAWTVTLHYQTLVALTLAWDRLGMSDLTAEWKAMAATVLDEFHRRLMPDGIVTGLAYFGKDGHMDPLLHPRDRTTGVSFSLLPMIHAIINNLFTPDEAARHLDLIHTHLTGPDGARLFDRPMDYRGGLQQHFQRAETAAYFGREIALMYTHAHLRYAECLAHYGDTEGFFRAISQAHPIGIRDRVPPATLRQANCYYSSSDAALADRYQASAQYDRIIKGQVPLDGGWRVYSSGAGIWTRLFLTRFLGVCRQKSVMIIDPVIPKSLDGLRIETQIEGHALEINYRIQASGFGPMAINLNGTDLAFTRGANPYRVGAAEIPMEAVRARLAEGANRMVVCLG